MLSMSFKHPSSAVAAACVALALPAVASAKLTEIGDVQPAATPACPAKPCYALTRTTGYQAKIGTKRGTHVIPRDGKIVAWSITLGKPGKKQIKFFDDNLGGTASAQITILRPGTKLRYRVVGQSPAVKVQPYFGTTVLARLARQGHLRRDLEADGARRQQPGPVLLPVPRRAPDLQRDVHPGPGRPEALVRIRGQSPHSQVRIRGRTDGRGLGDLAS
jgi:hypothetical protein